MATDQHDLTGEFRSPGGFVFGVVGWTWGEQKPTSITFFLDGTCKVSDQHGRPVKGVVKDGRPVLFAKCTHAQVIAALEEERIDWRKLVSAGWPQLPYDTLKTLQSLPPWPFARTHMPASTSGAPCTCISCSIRDPKLRKDAVRIRAEMDEAMTKEMQVAEE